MLAMLPDFSRFSWFYALLDLLNSAETYTKVMQQLSTTIKRLSGSHQLKELRTDMKYHSDTEATIKSLGQVNKPDSAAIAMTFTKA